MKVMKLSMISDFIDEYWYYLCLDLDGHHNGDDCGLGDDYDKQCHYGRR